MKLTLSFIVVLLMAPAQLSAQGVFDRIKQSATDKVNQRVDDKTNSTTGFRGFKANGRQRDGRWQSE